MPDKILPLSLRDRDRQDRLDDDLEDKIRATNNETRTFDQQLGCQILVRFSINPSKEVEPVVPISAPDFIGEILIRNVELPIKSARKGFQVLILWLDSVKHDPCRTGVPVAEKKECENDERVKKITLGKNKEIIEVEL